MTRGLRAFAAGLQLQAQYPGNPSSGNASITGSFGVLGGIQALGNSGQTGAVVGLGGFAAPFLQGVTSTYDVGAVGNGGIANTIAMGEQSVIRAQNNVLSGIFLGAQQQIYGATSGAIGIGIGVVIGTNGSSTNLAPIVIGSGAAFLTSTVSTTQDGIVIGRGAKIQTQTPLVIPGSVVIGRSGITLATGTTKGCIVIGDGLALGAVTPVDNTILIDQWGTGVTPVRDISNAIIIGNSTHQQVIIAGRNLGSSLVGCVYRKQANVVIANTAVETSVLDGTLYTFPANSFVKGQMVRGQIDGIFNVGAVASNPMIKMKLGAQTKTINLAAAIPNTGGNVQFRIRYDWMVVGTGGAGSTNFNATLEYQTAAGTNTVVMAGTRGIGDAFDTTVGNLHDVTLTWSVADPNATAQISTGSVETF